MYKGEKIERCN